MSISERSFSNGATKICHYSLDLNKLKNCIVNYENSLNPSQKNEEQRKAWKIQAPLGAKKGQSLKVQRELYFTHQKGAAD
ncbi:unnamed protein product [Blepharisma stoltei]|uniref:Uncharacterized protein n=1 Tax=Blepharisma stoltei TaxID=1481888 RepID=A0AAU9KDM6_9CILI|nr:unnamed protein product [Blepharisma stoltei]